MKKNILLLCLFVPTLMSTQDIDPVLFSDVQYSDWEDNVQSHSFDLKENALNIKGTTVIAWNDLINAFEADSTVWKTRLELGIPGLENSHATETVLYGDTIVGNVKWRILSMHDITGLVYLKGLIRSEIGKVMFRAYPGYEGQIIEKETVIYDFSLEVGDFFDPWGRGGVEVKKVDSIVLSDGRKHKKIYFEGDYFNYVEGLGCDVYDPFYMIYTAVPTMPGFSTLISCHVNGELLYTNPSYSDYTPLLNENKRWNVLYENASRQKQTHVFKFKGDTVIEGRQYSILWMSVDEKVEDWRRLGYMRENIEEGKVYYRPSWGDRDGLLYDYSAEENDTVYTIGSSWFELSKPNGGDYWITDSILNVVKSVDLVKLNDEYYKRVNVVSKLLMPEAGGDVFENEWIGGVGNLKGLFSYNVPLSGAPVQTLLAFYQNEELIYQSQKHNQDFIWVNVDNEYINSKQGFSVSLYGQQLFIKNELNDKPYVITLYSVSGSMILEHKENSPSAIIQLPVSLRGVFIVNINDGKRNVSEKIFIK